VKLEVLVNQDHRALVDLGDQLVQQDLLVKEDHLVKQAKGVNQVKLVGKEKQVRLVQVVLKGSEVYQDRQVPPVPVANQDHLESKVKEAHQVQQVNKANEENKEHVDLLEHQVHEEK
jgi:hypothetical protein